MNKDIILLFESLLGAAEARKVDFKGKQYRLDNDVLKSQFIKDILCMANAPGSDGYILLGITGQKYQPVVTGGISKHYDSASLEELVASIIEEPIHFDYYPLKYKGKDCALIHIPSSKARPHWPKKDFGKLKKHVFYTRRSSANREASLSEIREMLLSSIRVADITKRKSKTPTNIVDELANYDVKQRKQKMYEMLKDIVTKIPMKKYSLISVSKYGIYYPFVVMTGISNIKPIEYIVFMYPISTSKDEILRHRRIINNMRDACSYYNKLKGKPKKGRMVINGHVSYSYNETMYEMGKRLRYICKRLKNYILIHISYDRIYTRLTGLGWGGLQFQNSWDEPWGKIMKWAYYEESPFYEFLIPNVISKIDMYERLSSLVAWVNNHPIDYG